MTLRTRSPAGFAIALLLLAIGLAAATLHTRFGDLSGFWWQSIVAPTMTRSVRS
ncbi:hypothetical protein [Salinicola acroporae]|uniref:hypothetical protein n=1 Tax=Salinicola acroporae TaxID=1541440 RepID=UPI002457322D|nr:hypothetical protein [Salinicola acroporae]